MCVQCDDDRVLVFRFARHPKGRVSACANHLCTHLTDWLIVMDVDESLTAP